jgi:NAD(P)-dependent dehydrogenase (short-subunit alcohol dehydrogenase family)
MAVLKDLVGKVAIVTGGASGIGRGIAVRLIEAGASVIIADIEQGRLDETAAAIGASAFRLDVRDRERHEALLQFVLAEHGRLDIVCLNAGIGPMGPISSLTYDDWKWMIDVNLWGTINGIQTFLPTLRGNPDGGYIIATSSMSGLRASPNLGAYAVSKYGIVALCEALAAELEMEGSKVGVSVLCPGPVRSDLGRSSRNRPADLLQGSLKDVTLEEAEHFQGAPIPYVEPEDAGGLVVDAIRTGEFYILTHPELMEFVEERHRAIIAATQRALSSKA